MSRQYSKVAALTRQAQRDAAKLALQRKAKPLTDLQMIQSPLEWPRWPLLPLKAGARNERMGVMVANGKPIVYLANLYTVKSVSDLQAGPLAAYETFADLVADGWRVD